MYTRRNIKFSIVFRFAWAKLIFFTFWSILAVFIFHEAEHAGMNFSIPFLPLSTIGIAVAFYVGFKNNASYDRFWEARKIWGGIVNSSRTWGNQVLNFVTTYRSFADISSEDLHLIQKKLIYRHLAWLNALRLQLRQPTSFSPKHPRSVKSYLTGSDERMNWDNGVACFLGKTEYDEMIGNANTATQIIRKQGDDLRQLMHESGMIDDFRHMEMMRVLELFYDYQGKCERIKNTPFPRQYAYFSQIFTWIFILLLPFGMVGEFAKMGHSNIFLTIPFCVLISWVFSTMEVVGDNSEDPFENFINDVPMTALCRTIEIDLREMLGETDLPPKIKPENDILY